MQSSIQGLVREIFWVHGDIRTALFGGILQFCAGSSLEDAQGLFQSCFRGYPPLVCVSLPTGTAKYLMRNNGRTETSEVPKASTHLLVTRFKHSASSTGDSTTENIHVHTEWISSSDPTPIYWPD